MNVHLYPIKLKNNCDEISFNVFYCSGTADHLDVRVKQLGLAVIRNMSPYHYSLLWMAGYVTIRIHPIHEGRFTYV